MLITLAAGLIPIPVIYLFYYRYFSLKKSFISHLKYFAFGVLLACFLVIGNPFLAGLIPARNLAVALFLRAAVVEKLDAFILILFLMYHETRVSVFDFEPQWSCIGTLS